MVILVEQGVVVEGVIQLAVYARLTLGAIATKNVIPAHLMRHGKEVVMPMALEMALTGMG